MTARPLRLSSRLGLSHGLIVALLFVVLLVTLQGLLRMLGLITDIRDTRLSSVDADEAMHRAAWRVETAVRHGATQCTSGRTNETVRSRIQAARNDLLEVLERTPHKNTRLGAAAERYVALADGAVDGDTCVYLSATTTDTVRAALDEEMTDAWIERLHELHSDIRDKEEAARRTGNVTAAAALGVAAAAAVLAAAITRATARSVAQPIAALARAATRVGEGDFAPIARVDGPQEVGELWRDLEGMRERLMELDRLKQSFLANVSHELRSPLARLREALGLLSDGTCGPTNAQQERVLTLARRACEREVRIVEALLDMSRVRSGLSLQREAGCDVDRIIAAALDDERQDAEERGVNVEVVTDGVAPSLSIDGALVERAIANLVRNAVSVSRRKGLVRVTRAVRAASGTSVRAILVDVRDDGPGIDDDVRAHLFKPFAPGVVRGVDRSPGIGIGLAFARDVARAHGGELVVAASSSSGTTFRFELPAPGGETR